MLSRILPNEISGSSTSFSGRYPFFAVEQPIIGRADDIRKLSQWIRQAPSQETLMLLVEGDGGVGKTAFINQLILELGEGFDFNLYGKFHNASSRLPFLALKQCMHHWLDQLLVLKDETYELLKQNVREAIHPHEKVLTSVLDELEVLFGKKAIPEEEIKMGPQQERLRFTYYFHKLLKAVHDSKLRTILILDDLQWADFATLQLIHDLLHLYEVPGLVLIGSYRPLEEAQTAGKIQKIQALPMVKTFVLNPLKQEEINQLVPSAWELGGQEQKAFQEYLLHESGGKPFDALQILSHIAQEKLIEATVYGNYQVRWDKLPRFKHDESAIVLVKRGIQDLSQEGSLLLQLASCIGFYFSCVRLQQLCLLEPPAFERGLQELIERKIIVRQQEACYFVHDHFHTAAQVLLLPENKRQLHTRIARFLIQQGALEPQHPDFFDCVNHLNVSGAGNSLVEGAVLAIINLSAGKLAQEKSAFDKSLEYYKISEHLLSSAGERATIQLPDFLPAYSWLPQQTTFEQVYNICKFGIAEGEFLVQNFILADQALNYILKQVDDRLMRLRAYTIRLKICIACLNIREAPLNLKDSMGITEDLLRSYHIFLPQTEADYKTQVATVFQEIKGLLQQHDIDQLENRAVSDDLEFQDLIHFVVHALPTLFFVDVNKSKYLALLSMRMCLRKGFTPSTPTLFASSIWTIASLGSNYDLAYQLGLLGLKLVEKHPYKVYKHAVYHLATLNFFNWKHSYREASAKLDEVTEYSLGLGDYNYSVFCNTNARLLDIFRGVALPTHPYYSYHPKSRAFTINFISKCHAAYVRCMAKPDAGLLDGKFRFSKNLKKEAEENLNYLFHLSFVKEQLYFHAGRYAKALEAGNICEKHRILYEGLPIGNEHDFYYSLLLCQMAQGKGKLEEPARKIVESRLAEFKRLAAMGSGNYLHKQKIIEAELACIGHQFLEAISFYDQATEEALKNEFVNYAALAAERTGACLLQIGKKRLADVYLNDACSYYQKWGALAKTAWLREAYPDIQFKSSHTPFYGQGKAAPVNEVFQWGLIDSAINLSKELYLNDLISKALKISAEQSQAQTAFFLLKHQYSWQIVARMDEEGLSMVHQNLDANGESVPRKMIYECLRLKKTIYIPSTQERPDPYDKRFFQSHAVRSCLLIPLERHQEVSGLIYLENIPPELVESKNLLPWFELLRTQTGIALFNAQLYENQVKLNQEIHKQEQKRIAAVVETQEKERRRVAAELHDHLGQMLSLTKLNLSRLEDSLEGQFALYEETCRHLDESCAELRRIAHDMMPPDFESKSLTLILDSLFRKYLLAAGLSYTFSHHQLPEELPIAIKFNLYRIAQEIIHNVIKHAAATNVTIGLSVEDHKLHMLIEDNGKGFDAQFSTDGLGLKGLYARVNLLSGRLEIDSVINSGSVFHVYIPLP